MLEYKRDIYDDVLNVVIAHWKKPFRIIAWIVTGEWMAGHGPFTPHDYNKTYNG